MAGCCIYLACHAEPFWAAIGSSQGAATKETKHPSLQLQKVHSETVPKKTCKKGSLDSLKKKYVEGKENDVTVIKSHPTLAPFTSKLPAFPGEPLLGKRDFRSKHPKKAVTSGSRT